MQSKCQGKECPLPKYIPPPYTKQFPTHNLWIISTSQMRKINKTNYGIRHERQMKVEMSPLLLIELIGEHGFDLPILHPRIRGQGLLWWHNG